MSELGGKQREGVSGDEGHRRRFHHEARGGEDQLGLKGRISVQR